MSIFTGCTVCCHEDVPRHIWGLFEALGIQYRWVLTRGPLARALVTAEDLVASCLMGQPRWMPRRQPLDTEQLSGLPNSAFSWPL